MYRTMAYMVGYVQNYGIYGRLCAEQSKIELSVCTNNPNYVLDVHNYGIYGRLCADVFYNRVCVRKIVPTLVEMI